MGPTLFIQGGAHFFVRSGAFRLDVGASKHDASLGRFASHRLLRHRHGEQRQDALILAPPHHLV